MATAASMPAYLLPGVPVHQPPHLEGDASLATEILPGPPSSAAIQQLALKRDPKKPSIAYSYLPPSDPGSTYSGIIHGTLVGQDSDTARSKRARGDKAATGRAQRATARQQGNSLVAPLDLAPSASTVTGCVVVDSDSNLAPSDDVVIVSSATSSIHMQSSDPVLATETVKLRKKDKGKGKEVDAPPLRVKDEQAAYSLPLEPLNLLNNEDHCSSCRSSGALIYCDGCPKAFHFWCLDPPLAGVDEARWFCPTCVARKHPPRKPPPSLLSPAIHQLQTGHPVEFQLPEDIRTFFKDVGTGPKGNYVDTSDLKPPRLNRLGQLEDRDPYRLRDRNGGPVLCFGCGMSALPNTLTSSAPVMKRARRSTSKATSPDAWKSMVSCDYCTLHWHLDCLNPPLPTLPPFNKKWMCPNHSEKIVAPKRRIPKHNAPPIDIVKPRQFNNGNIEVTNHQYSAAPPILPVAVDEILINGRRYRVPEKIIVLDFWNKLNKWDEHLHRDEAVSSGLSSPLTELSSLDESDEQTLSNRNSEFDDFTAAQILCGLATGRATDSYRKKHTDRGIQTDAIAPAIPATKPRPGRPRKNARVVKSVPNGVEGANTNSRSYQPPAVSESASTSTSVTTQALRKKRATQVHAVETTSRELRSTSRNHNHDTPLTSVSSMSSLREFAKEGQAEGSGHAPSTSFTKQKVVSVKMEEVESSLSTTWPGDATQKQPRIIRTPRQAAQKVPTATPKEGKEKRGKKRKARDDDLPNVDGENEFDHRDPRELARTSKEAKSDAIEKVDREVKKIIRTPSRQKQLSNVNQATPSSSTAGLQSPSTTPSLKIRLPRLSNFNIGAGTPVSQPETPTRR